MGELISEIVLVHTLRAVGNMSNILYLITLNGVKLDLGG